MPDRARGTLTGLTVLIVEDDHDSRELLDEYLRVCGALAVTAESAANALGFLDHLAPDIIISDISLPDEDGYALLARIRATLKGAHDVPAIALSGHRADDAERTRAGLAGFNAYLEKPVDLEKLCVLIRDLVPTGD